MSLPSISSLLIYCLPLWICINGFRFIMTSLHNRVLTLTLVGFLLSTIIVTLIVSRALQQDTIERLVEQQKVMVNMVVKQMDSALQDQINYLEIFAETLHTKDALYSNKQIPAVLKADHSYKAFSAVAF